MKNLLFIILTSLLFTLLFLTCEQNKNIISSQNYYLNKCLKLNYSKEDSIEAKEFALWLSCELSTSDSLVYELLYNLNYLRCVYENSFPVLNKNNRFLPPWVISELCVKVDDTTAVLIKNHQYMGWDLLEASLKPDSIIQYPDILGWALLGFDEYYHPQRLAEIYSTLPGVIWSGPNGRCFTTLSGYPFYPGLLNGELTYLFTLPPGMTQYYFYFKYVNGVPQHIGTWNRADEPEPSWWQEAKTNINNFETWDGNY